MNDYLRTILMDAEAVLTTLCSRYGYHDDGVTPKDWSEWEEARRVKAACGALLRDERVAFVETNLRYLPQPNVVETVLTRELAPQNLTTTAFLLAMREDGSLIMANNTRRGLEFAGGHIEDGETAAEAARRECYEETGYIVSWAMPIGYLRMTCEGSAEEGYKYPHPVSYQQFFVGIIRFKDPGFKPTDECHLPQELSAEAVLAKLQGSRLKFYEAARAVICRA